MEWIVPGWAAVSLMATLDGNAVPRMAAVIHVLMENAWAREKRLGGEVI